MTNWIRSWIQVAQMHSLCRMPLEMGQGAHPSKRGLAYRCLICLSRGISWSDTQTPTFGGIPGMFYQDVPVEILGHTGGTISLWWLLKLPRGVAGDVNESGHCCWNSNSVMNKWETTMSLLSKSIAFYFKELSSSQVQVVILFFTLRQSAGTEMTGHTYISMFIWWWLLFDQ